MPFSTYVATLVGGFALSFIQNSGRGKGEAAPGLLALKIDPLFLQHRQTSIPVRIVVSGTNGKTTTTNLISHTLRSLGKKIVTNPNGSNLSRGIASALLAENATVDCALWEADEAAFVDIVTQTQPTHIVLTNLFRDQLDRYGEIDTTLKKWQKVLSQIPPTTLILNANDPSLAYLGMNQSKHAVSYFGLSNPVRKKTKNLDVCADALFCPVCSKPLDFTYVYFSHLACYRCSCGFSLPKLTWEARDITVNPDQVAFSCGGKGISVQLGGLYSVFNALAAYSLVSALGYKPSQISYIFSGFRPVFGRQEVLPLENGPATVYLIKNPTGANQIIETLQLYKKDSLKLLICINDNYADGTDVSWLWDVDFEELKKVSNKIVVSGSRALDMALRLKYAGFEEKHFTVEPEIHEALRIFSKLHGEKFILPTYTALGMVRKIITGNSFS